MKILRSKASIVPNFVKESLFFMVVLQKLLFLLNYLTFGKRCVHASSMFLLNLLPLRLLDSRFVKLG